MARVRVTTHPGEILQHEFLEPLDMSARELALAIDVPPNRITDIIRARRNITADTALRLGRYFGMTPQFWMSLQAAYDLSAAQRDNDYSMIAERESA